jgi:Acetyltransferase (GNAT) domain
MFREQLLYVTILKSNDTIIAGDVNYINNKQICLKGINCHSPSYAKHSPGIFSLYFLTGHLANEGFEEIDITPGSELYKNILTTHYGQVYVLIVGSRYSKLSSSVRNTISHFFKTNIGKIASKADVEYNQLKKLRWQVLFFLDELKNIERQNLASLIRSWVTKTIIVKKARRYISHLDVATLESTSFAQLKKNSLSDLLAYEARGTLMSRWQFLRNAMKRLEVGETVYSWCKDGRLMGCVWLSRQQADENGGLQLESFYFHPKSQHYMLTFLKAVVTDVVQEQNPNPLYAMDSSIDSVLHQVLTEAGFKMAI